MLEDEAADLQGLTETFKQHCEEAPLYIRIWRQAGQIGPWFLSARQAIWNELEPTS